MTLDDHALDILIASSARVERKKLTVMLEWEMSQQNKDTSYGRSIIRVLSRIHEQVMNDNSTAAL